MVGISKRPRWLWLMPILLTAVLLRLHDLSHIPPGMTHDEADHGITAQAILAGEHAVYFTIGYGREPLYDYATALMMSAIGPTYFAGRVTAVYFSLLTLALLFALTKTALDVPTALLATAAMGVGFWAVMSGRLSLRSVTLPVFFLSGSLLYLRAVLFHWRREVGDWQRKAQSAKRKAYSLKPFITAGLLLGLSLYTYIPARALWLVVPVVLLYLLLFASSVLSRVWQGSVVTLITGVLVGVPLFRYLAINPDVEVRIQELRAPITALRQGNFQPLLQNGLASLRLFFIEGDSAWRYNIAGRPWLPPWLALFFVIGLIVVVVWAIRPFRNRADHIRRRGLVAWFLLAWLALGFSSAFVTGPDLSSTQAIGMQPVLYLLVGIGMKRVGDWGVGSGDGLPHAHSPKAQISQRTVYSLQLTALLLIGVTAVTSHFAMQRWGKHPEVRIQYESAMVTAIDYVNQIDSSAAVSISTVTPGQYHTPALGAMTLRNGVEPRWFNAATSLVIPATPTSTVILSGFSPLGGGVAEYFETAVPHYLVPQPETDRDRPLTVYRVEYIDITEEWSDDFVTVGETVQIEDAILLKGFDIKQVTARPGDTVQLGTLWQIGTPFNQEARLFTHLLDTDGTVLTQQDLLDAPATSWQSGDWLVQVHMFRIPAETAAGSYPLVVGLYTCPQSCKNGQRLSVFVNGQEAGTTYSIGEISITP